MRVILHNALVWARRKHPVFPSDPAGAASRIAEEALEAMQALNNLAGDKSGDPATLHGAAIAEVAQLIAVAQRTLEETLMCRDAIDEQCQREEATAQAFAASAQGEKLYVEGLHETMSALKARAREKWARRKEGDAFSQQVGGDHYKRMGDAQPWRVLPHWLTSEELRGYAKGEAIVYLARERQKGGREDIRKARHVLDLYLSTEVPNDK